MWLGVLLFLSGAMTASAQLFLIVDGEGTALRQFLLAGSVLVAAAGLGFFLAALRERNRNP